MFFSIFGIIFTQKFHLKIMQKNVSYFFPSIIPKRNGLIYFFCTECTQPLSVLHFYPHKDSSSHLSFSQKFVICLSFLNFFSFDRILCKKRKHPIYKDTFRIYHFFLNRPLISKPRFSSRSSSADSEMNSIYLPVPMATQLTASSATMAWMPVFCWISLSRP